MSAVQLAAAAVISFVSPNRFRAWSHAACAWKGASAAVSGASNVARGGVVGLVVEKIRQTKRLTCRESGFLRRHSPGDIKMTLPTANQLPKWRRYVQEEMAVDPDQALEEVMQVDNACLQGVKRDGAVFAMHLCRGNNRSQWLAEGGYDPIAGKLFNQLNVDVFLLESERAGSFEPLRGQCNSAFGSPHSLLSRPTLVADAAINLPRLEDFGRRSLPLLGILSQLAGRAPRRPQEHDMGLTAGNVLVPATIGARSAFRHWAITPRLSCR